MLYTSCPDCETTFRVTEIALQQADGQVRCGRCGNVFDARTSLTNQIPEAAKEGPAETGGAVEHSEAHTASQDSAGKSASSQATQAPASPLTGPDGRPAAPDAVSALASPSGRNGVMSADEIEAVLTKPAPAPPPPSHWLDDEKDREDPDPKRERIWLIAAICAAAVFGLQTVHHFRSPLAGVPVLGAALQSTYELFGAQVTPDWDVTAYELIDWTAYESGNEGGGRNLVIRSELKNEATRAQPFPMIQLRLLDRWEETVSARLFDSAEYVSDRNTNRLLQSGESIETELIIVDPGTDAYGFELSVCLQTTTGISCDSDATFR